MAPASRPHKYGDVREDGKVFLGYQKSCKNGERWVTAEGFARAQEQRLKYRKSPKGRETRKLYGRLYDKTDKRREYRQRYRKSEARKEYTRKYDRERYNTNPLARLATQVRNHAYRATKYAGLKKPSTTFELLGTDLETFKNHIESQFTEGMTWENHGEWHIDHVVPLASAKGTDEIWNLCHYTNLQPLWGPDNISKGSKIPQRVSTN